MVSGLNNGNRKDYSKYDEMSTESLEELLRLDAQLPDGEESDMDAIIYISEVIARREKENPAKCLTEADIDTAWKTFQTQYRPYAKDGRSLYDFDDNESVLTEAAVSTSDASPVSCKKSASTRSVFRIKRIAATAVAIAALVALTSVTAQAFGYDLWGVIAQWTKSTFTFVPASKVNDEKSSSSGVALRNEEYADLQAALDAYGVTESLIPTWIPTEFKLESIYVDGDTDPTRTVFQSHYNSEGQRIIIQINMYQDAYTAQYSTWQKDDKDITSVEIEDCIFYFMENAERNCVVWTNGPFECSIIGDVSLDELSEMVDSIYVKDD